MSGHCSFLPFKLPDNKFRVNAFKGLNSEEAKEEDFSAQSKQKIQSQRSLEMQDYPTTASEDSSPAPENRGARSSGPDLNNI